jgi:transposase
VFIRKKKNSSGSVSVQILSKSKGKTILVETVGCGRNESEIVEYERIAKKRIVELAPQQGFDFLATLRDRTILEFLQQDTSILIEAVGPELILGGIFDKIGFSQISEELFRDLVLARLVYPVSKLKTTEYLLQHKGKSVEVTRIYRFLDKLKSRYKCKVEKISYEYSKGVLGKISVVFYDMTTLYFEAEDEDDLRKIGFSKDGKFQKPQIMLGLLVGEDGYPIAYEIYEGNTFEGKTLLPAIENAQSKYGLPKPVVIADSALLSKANIKKLIEQKYRFILGARIKNESSRTKQKILQSCTSLEDGTSVVIDKTDGVRLVVSYSAKRARKDASNREKGIKRLQERVRSGKLTKQQINNRGYNKFLVLKGEVTVAIDPKKIEEDQRWDGLKGYVTNSTLPPDEVVAQYQHLWKIEKAFRISKTDLRIRPIFHRKKDRIEAHLCIAFVAYTIFKELERLLKIHNLNLSPQKAIELSKTIYKFTFRLPDSQKQHQIMPNLTPIQKKLLDIVTIR